VSKLADILGTTFVGLVIGVPVLAIVMLSGTCSVISWQPKPSSVEWSEHAAPEAQSLVDAIRRYKRRSGAYPPDGESVRRLFPECSGKLENNERIDMFRYGTDGNTFKLLVYPPTLGGFGAPQTYRVLVYHSSGYYPLDWFRDTKNHIQGDWVYVHDATSYGSIEPSSRYR